MADQYGNFSLFSKKNIARPTGYQYPVGLTTFSEGGVPTANAATNSTGGTQTVNGSIAVQTFDSSATFVPKFDGFVNFLVVGGGAGGAGNLGGGGGAGGVRQGILYVTEDTTYNVSVGGGGAGGGTGSDGTNGANGTNSMFATVSSSGGGYGAQGGGGSPNSENGALGGSGGGAGGYAADRDGGFGNKGLIFPVEGHDGGRGDSAGAALGAGGGGGGAGAPGGDSIGGSPGGSVPKMGFSHGGAGVNSSIDFTSTAYGGGGSCSRRRTCSSITNCYSI